MPMSQAAPKRQGAVVGVTTGADKGAAGFYGKATNCAQRIEIATMRNTQVPFADFKSWDAEALFRKYDAEKTQLLSRGALTELLREIGLDKKLGDTFHASARLAFDAHSADTHFLALPEFKQLYHHISTWHPGLLPRETMLKITILGAKDLPPMDTNGKSDPFCTVMCCKVDGNGKLDFKHWSKSATKVVDKTLNPWWGEDFTDKYGYEEGDALLFQVWDWDKADKSEMICKALLPSSEFHRPGGFQAALPLIVCTDAPKGPQPILKVRVAVNGMPVPPSRLNVTIHGARGLPPADANGKADSFCLFQIVGKPFSRGSTKIVTKTLEPQWGESFDGKYRYDDGDNLLFEVRDYDGKGAKPELLGRYVMPNDMFSKMGGFHGEVPLIDVARGSLPSETGRPYAPWLKLTVFLTDMMPVPAAPSTPSGAAGGTADGDAGAAEGTVAG